MSKTLIGIRNIAAPGPGSFARWRGRLRPVLAAYAAVAAVAVALCLHEDALFAWLGFLLASALPLVGLPLGLRLFRPSSVAPWLLLWAGQVAFFLGDVVLFGAEMGTIGSPWDASVDVAYLAGYPLTALGLGLFILRRLPTQRMMPLIDAIAVGAAGAMILWLVHVESFIHDGALDPGEMLVALGYPLGDALLLGAMAYLLLAARTTGTASRLLVASLVSLLVADVLSTTYLSASANEAWADILWATSYALMGAAALVPSMRELTEPAADVSGSRTRRRLLVLVGALLAIPLTAIIQQLVGGHLHGWVFVVAAVALGTMLALSSYDAARQARKQERRWATLLAKASDAFAVVAADGKLAYVSPASERIMGSPAESKVGRSAMLFANLVHPDDRAGAGARLAEALKTPAADVQERLRVLPPGGGLRWLEIQARNLLDDPDVNGVVINYRDVTEQVEAERELKHRAHLLAGAEELARLGSWEWHPASDTRHTSPGMWRLLGLQPGSAPPDVATLLSRVHPDDLGRVQSAYSRLLEDRRTTSLDFRIVRPDDSIVEVHGLGEIELTADGRIERVIATLRDVTEEREAERQLRSQADVLASVRDSIVVTDLEGRITFWSNGAATLFGYQAHEVMGCHLEIIYGDAAAGVLEPLQNFDQGTVDSGEVIGRRKDDSDVRLDVRSTVWWSADGEARGYISIASDATERHAARASLDRLWAAIEQSSESVVITDADASIEYVNPAFERTSGYSREEVRGQNPRILNSGTQAASVYESMWSTLGAGQTWIADLVNRRKDGSTFLEHAAISPIQEESGKTTGYVAVKRDVTAERRREEESARHIRERSLITQTIRGFQDDAAPSATAEAIGRQLSRLSGVATAGLFIFGPDGCAVPYGFTLKGEPISDYESVPRRRSEYLLGQAQRGPWIAAWEDRPWHPYNRVFSESGVVAIAYAPVRRGSEVIGFLHLSSDDSDAYDTLASHLVTLVQVADITGALLGARLNDLNTSEATRLGISRIISGSAFIPVFQPIVDLGSGEVVGYEGLTRFRDRVRPDLRFAEAERAGMGQKLELATLEAAMTAARDLPESAWLDLNVSPGLVMESVELARLLQDADRPIVLEVTEHERIDEYEGFRSAVERLGGDVRIAVDDAGSGYASLRHILELRPALVKLDRALVMGIESDQARRALVAGMRRFAGDADIQLIAEGIETEAELEALREIEVELGQGFLLGRPRPAREGS